MSTTEQSSAISKSGAAAWCFLFVATCVARAVVFRLRPGTFDWPTAILLMDIAALVPIACSSAMGALLGRMFGSVVLTAVCVGLPVAGLGWLSEKIGGREVSNMVGRLCLLGIGVGFGVASWSREDLYSRCVLIALGLGALAFGISLIVDRYTPEDASLVAAPYLIAACASGLLRIRRPLFNASVDEE